MNAKKEAKMMSETDFTEAIKPMTELYGPMDQPMLGVYYGILKKHNMNIFRKAVFNVLEFHKYKNWPPIGVFSEAIEDIKRESSVPTAKELKKRYDKECESCGNTGWKLTKKSIKGTEYDYFIYCQCPVGQDMKAAHEEGKRRKRENK